ncbi:MAG: N-6 DNA methylase [Candidatus Thorarchaeota archaeon]
MDGVGSDPRTQKKKLGSFYTPPHLAKLITRNSLDTWLRNQSDTDTGHQLELIQNLKILDPSVGAGVFLMAAANWLDSTRQRLGEKLSTKKRRESIVRDSLFGVDVEESAIASCRSEIIHWFSSKVDEQRTIIDSVSSNIRHGNSLTSYDWTSDFSGIFSRENPGFDIILGNPPYGNLLSKDERDFIQTNYPFNVGGNRTGTWNSAAHFIVRANMLLRQDGELGFLIPNSILRVKQFTKTRQFLLKHFRLWKIIDEGSPFDDVTLEMVTIFCTKQKHEDDFDVEVESRRPNFEQKHSIPLRLLRSSKIFPIYHDEIFERILKKGQKNLLVASRGRDIPHDYVKQSKTKEFTIPYITSGRSVRRYYIDSDYQTYTNDWYLRNQGMKKSFSTELLVATKNYRFPRCVIKPAGTIHGGGIVQIKPTSNTVNLRTLGLVLNSRLIQFICIRYLTNYSQLTTCLNTGIIEELPIILPEYPDAYAFLFDALSRLYNEEQSPGREKKIKAIETVSEALVYDLYFGSSNALQKEVAQLVETSKTQIGNLSILCDNLNSDSLASKIDDVMQKAIVNQIENRLNTVPTKSPRY